MTIVMKDLEPPAGSDPQSRMAALAASLGAGLVGRGNLVERLLVALVAGGHVLVEGAPGLAKTRAVKRLASGLEVHPRLEVEGAVLGVHGEGDLTVQQRKGATNRRNVDRQEGSVQDQDLRVQELAHAVWVLLHAGPAEVNFP